MRLALLLVLIATSAAAQTPDSTATRRRGPSADLVLGGAAAGVTTVLFANLALRTAGVSEDRRGWVYLLYPVGVALGVNEIARRGGRGGSLGHAAHGAIRGTLIGAGGLLVAGVGVGALLGGEGGLSLLLPVGLAIAVVAPPYFAAAEYGPRAVQPVVLVGPDGERTAGLSLRVGL